MDEQNKNKYAIDVLNLHKKEAAAKIEQDRKARITLNVLGCQIKEKSYINPLLKSQHYKFAEQRSTSFSYRQYLYRKRKTEMEKFNSQWRKDLISSTYSKAWIKKFEDKEERLLHIRDQQHQESYEDLIEAFQKLKIDEDHERQVCQKKIYDANLKSHLQKQENQEIELARLKDFDDFKWRQGEKRKAENKLQARIDFHKNMEKQKRDVMVHRAIDLERERIDAKRLKKCALEEHQKHLDEAHNKSKRNAEILKTLKIQMFNNDCEKRKRIRKSNKQTVEKNLSMEGSSSTEIQATGIIPTNGPPKL